MRRRTILLGGFGLAIAGCGRNGTTPPAGTGEPVTLPSGPAVWVAGYTVSGGFLPLGYNELTAPRLAVYSDGTAIAGARYQLGIGTAETGTLVGELRAQLAQLPKVVTATGKNMIMDAATTYLEVLTADGGHKQVAAYALEELDYPAAVKNAHTRLQALAKKVTGNGKPYIAERIRLIATPAPDSSPAGAWPAGVPVPPESAAGLRSADLSGAAALQAIAGLPASAGQSDAQWPVVSTPGSGNLAVAWRYLLPNE